MSETSTNPRCLPRWVKAAVGRLARADGIRMNRFVATAVVEKLAVMDTVACFEERAARAHLAAFRVLLNPPGGETPREGDER